MMKCIAICVVLGALFGGLAAQTFAPKHVLTTADGVATAAHITNQVAFAQFAGGVSGTWLTVGRHNVKDYEDRGFDPSFTDITSDFKPIVTRKGRQWSITFTSEIAENIP